MLGVRGGGREEWRHLSKVARALNGAVAPRMDGWMITVIEARNLIIVVHAFISRFCKIHYILSSMPFVFQMVYFFHSASRTAHLSHLAVSAHRVYSSKTAQG